METTTVTTVKLQTVNKHSYATLQSADIGGYKIAYNEKAKMKQFKSDGTIVPYTKLTLHFKSKNGKKAYQNVFTNMTG